MKKYTILLSCIILISMISCGTETTTLIDQTQHLEQGYYWYGSFSADAGVNLDVDIEVTSGGAVDVLLMDQQGFNDFKAIFEEDTLIDGGQSLNPEYYGYHSFNAESGDDISFIFDADLPVDIYLVDETNFSLYQNVQTFTHYVGHDSIDTAVFNYNASATEVLYFIIDNTSNYGSIPIGTVTYTILAAKRKGTTFAYYATGSALNVTSKSYTFETPATGTYHVVVNNAGNVQGGAIPQGSINFYIVITGQ